MTEQRRTLKKSDILRTMAKRADEKSKMVICLLSGGCAWMLVLFVSSNWVWNHVHQLIGIVFGAVPCVALPILLFSLIKVLWKTHQKRKSILHGDITIMTDELCEIRKCEETYYSHSSHRIKKITYDVFEFARGNTFTMKTGLWTQSEKNRARDQFGVGQSFILVVYQKKSWELQLIYPEALYEYVDDMEAIQ